MKRVRLVVCVAVAIAVSAAALAAPVYALVPDGAHGWFWQMPQPSAGLNDIAFPGAAEVWVVGTDGLVEHSTDAGATWVAQPTSTDADLWSVSFTDDRHGWACGGDEGDPTAPGVILATTDGGAWVDRTPSGLTHSLTNVSFVDAAHGWIGTADGDVLKTTDGGVTWRTLKLAATYKESVTVDFVDATHGWAGGTKGRIWKTADGGKTWTASPQDGLNPQEFVVQIDFVDRSDGWALAQDDWGDSMVVATSDGGLLWRPVPTGDQVTTGIRASSAASVWLVGQSYDNLDLQNPTVFMHSSDGGLRWETSTVAAPANPLAVAAHGDAVCAVGDGILISSDAGATWRSASSGQQYWFSAASAVTATDVWAVDTVGALLHSTDGRRWVEQDSPARWATSLMGVAFPDRNDGWVVGASDVWGDGSVILHTADGGKTWVPQQSTLAGGLVGVDFLDASVGWAISSNPFPFGSGAPLALEHTTDGGATWIPQYVYQTTELHAVDFVDAQTGWAAGGWWGSGGGYPTGAIFGSTNGGYTWTREKLPKGAPDMTGVQFPSRHSGWAVGTSYDGNDDAVQSWVLHTTDGGKTWVRRADLNDSLATTVQFSDPSNGWLGGLNGVYATTDGGSTWQRVAGGDGVEAIAAADPQHVWAFGDGFLVSTLDAGGDTAAPVTLDEHYDYAWHRKPVTIDFSAHDIGGSGIGLTQFSLDGGAWRSGSVVVVPAAADHRNDGERTILYRSTDTVGNREQTEIRTVGIDTLGPACFAPRKSVVNTGELGALYFVADDATSGIRQATIRIVGSHGHVLRSFVERAGNWGMSPAP
ncbi:MAG: YCF48-related protein, partial [Thermoleophilia bacterium]